VSTQPPIRVLIVDDSALMRALLSDLLGADPGIVVVGTASDPLIARDRIKALNPDVITLDVEMPRMDGIAFLEKIMTLRPMPVLMVSSLTQAGADTTLRALELGAVDYVAKPMIDLKQGMQALREELIAKVKVAAGARVRSHGAPPARLAGAGYQSSERVVAIGASTGGVEALQEILYALPADSPAIVVTQHMPPVFTSSFARRLDAACAVAVAEASHDARVLPGHVYIAPGGRHLEIGRSGADYVCRIHDGELVSGHRPSVDVLFRSVARSAGANAVGVILTGMGRDGALGLAEMRAAGARTLGQDEASCLVYGMPKAAREQGGVETELGLAHIAGEVLRLCREAAPRRVRV
jgi:two-component system, chemotaxis family, protein-glutamate methylesterase/glutaminase